MCQALSQTLEREQRPPSSPDLSHPRTHFAWVTPHHHPVTIPHGTADNGSSQVRQTTFRNTVKRKKMPHDRV